MFLKKMMICGVGVLGMLCGATASAATSLYPQVYLRGTNNAWGTTAMSLVADNTWEATVNFGATSSERFKFDIYGNWATNFGDNNADGIAELAASTDVKITQGSGSYKITFYDNLKVYTIQKTGAAVPKVFSQLYFRGSPNNFGLQSMQLVNANTWRTTATFANTSNERFKFDVSGNWATNYGDNNADGFAELAGNDIKPVAGKAYNITFFDHAKAYLIQPAGPVNASPVANAGADITIKVGETASFNASGSSDPDGSIVSYAWSNGLSGQTPSLQYNSVGTYDVVLTVTDNGGATAQDTVRVNVTNLYASNFASLNLRGTHNNWGSLPMQLIANNTWQATASFGSTATERFKFDVKGDWTQNYGDNAPADGVADLAGADVTITQGPGDYRITFNDSTRAYSKVKIGGCDIYQLYLRSTASAGAPVAMSVKDANNCVYEGTVKFTRSANQNFKFSVTTDLSQVYGDSAPADGVAELNGAEIAIAGLAEYRITFYGKTLAYTATKIADVSPCQLPRVNYRGTSNNWAVAPMTCVREEEWEINTTFTGVDAHRFRFDLSTDWSQPYGDNNQDGTAELNGADIYVSNPGACLIKFNEASKAYTYQCVMQAQSAELSPSSAQLAVGQTKNLTFLATYIDGSKKFVNSTAQWQSSNNAVATVSTQGVVTAVAPGLATITATVDGASKQSVITVASVALTGLEITPNFLLIPRGTTLAATLTATYSDGSQQVIASGASWESMNTRYVTVNALGVATGVSVGDAYIKASYQGKTAVVRLWVSPPANNNKVTVHYNRNWGDYSGWGLHLWGEGLASSEVTNWNSPKMPAGYDAFGAYYTITVADPTKPVYFVMHKGETRDVAKDRSFKAQYNTDIWLNEGDSSYRTYPQSRFPASRALWLDKGVIGFPATSATSFKLFYSKTASLQNNNGVISGGAIVDLTADGTIPNGAYPKSPQANGFKRLRLSSNDQVRVADMLRGQVLVAAYNGSSLVEVTGLQISGVLDALASYTGGLGPIVESGVPTLRLWAPTAQNAMVYLYDDSTATAAEQFPMSFDAKTGVWSVVGAADWLNKYYHFGLDVYAPTTGYIETNMVTDPYSVSLSQNSWRSQLVDLNDASVKPAGWDQIQKPAVSAAEDISIYELHVRDFSAVDSSVPQAYRGKYKAFTAANSNAMQHIKALAQAGLTHVHIMPIADFGSINEDESQRQEAGDLSGFAADSEQQQAAVAAKAQQDSYNWGYDTQHYGVPEGSYATDSDGVTRILEVREMVKALHEAGLRVVLDMNYNHANAAGQVLYAVLDRVVPGYYHRLNGFGAVYDSSCCRDNATEFNMMEKLMSDTLVRWAKAYKVDGFRFDFMGHHTRQNMLNVQNRLRALTLQNDGVDGAGMYLYGEAWPYGSLYDRDQNQSFHQLNVAGSGIGAFNDRMRDAANGTAHRNLGLTDQGFVNGLFFDPNNPGQGGRNNDINSLKWESDRLRIALAGNLADFRFTDSWGASVTGASFGNGKRYGYTQDPQENLMYISAHDNRLLWDMLALKAPTSRSPGERTRMQNMAMSLVALGQGVPFFDAGMDLLRSRSGDVDSANSGDWFNRLDWTGLTHAWGGGLPPAENNADAWNTLRPRLSNGNLKADFLSINFARSYLREMLQIRKSTRLLRLRTKDEIMSRLTFEGTGNNSIPGLIVMKVHDKASTDLDPNLEEVVVLFNSRNQDTFFSYPNAQTWRNVQLHTVQRNGVDGTVKQANYNNGGFWVPARTTAVFVETQ